MKESKPGYKTTEFWLSIATTIASIAASIANILPAEKAGWLIAISNGLYAISRGIAKK